MQEARESGVKKAAAIFCALSATYVAVCRSVKLEQSYLALYSCSIYSVHDTEFLYGTRLYIYPVVLV